MKKNSATKSQKRKRPLRSSFADRKLGRAPLSVSAKESRNGLYISADLAEIERQLHLDAKGLGLHPGAADAFIGRVLRTISTQITHRQITNNRQLHAAIYRELKKYHPDFAYIFQNRDKIV